MSVTRIPFRSSTPRRGADRLSTLAFSWDGADGSLDALSGQAGTLVRATAGGAMLDSLGLVSLAAHSQARWEAVTDPVYGGTRLGLVLEPARTNLVLRSEDFGTTWAAAGTPTRSAAAKTAGDLVLDLIGDDAGGALEGYTQNLGFTGNAVKTVSLFVAQGSSTSSVVRLRDTTAAADRLRAVITWSAGAPVVAANVGTLIGIRALAGGVYELRLRTTSVTAANTNQLQVYPATNDALVVGGTGTLYAGGVAAYDRAGALAYSRNLGSPVALNADQLTWPFGLPRRRSWCYLRFVELGGRWAGAGGLATMGDGSGGTGLALRPGTTGYLVAHTVSAAGPFAEVAGWPAHLGLVELLATMDGNGRPTLEVAIDGTSLGTVTAGSDPADLTTAYTSALIRMGADAAASLAGGACYLALKAGEYGLGVPTLARARGYR